MPTHWVIKEKDGVSDFTACDTARSYLEKPTLRKAEVTCERCLVFIGRQEYKKTGGVSAKRLINKFK